MSTETSPLGPETGIPATLGGRIAAARREAGLTQEQLGQGIEVDGSDLGKACISSWEVGRSQPSAALVARLADRLNVSTEYLLRGREWNGAERRNKAQA